MFIRASSQVDKKTGRTYTTYRLVEAYRNQSGHPRQRTLLNLGCHFDILKDHWKMLADRVEEIVTNQTSLFELEPTLENEAQRIARLVTQQWADSPMSTTGDARNKPTVPTETTLPQDIQTVDINSLAHQDIRSIGCEHLAYHAAKQLQLDELLLTAGFNHKQMQTTLGTIIARLVQPGSELSTHRYLTQHSALDELLGVDFSTLPLKRLYQVSDQLLAKKSTIEKALYQREKDLFSLEETVTLYDITNTYFEGRSLANPKAQYGRSKEKRNDCGLVALGMVLDASGFPKKSEIFPGNVSEPKTMKQMLSRLEAGKQKGLHKKICQSAGKAGSFKREI